MPTDIDLNVESDPGAVAGVNPLGPDSDLDPNDFQGEAPPDAEAEVETQEEVPPPQPRSTGLPPRAYERLKGLNEENKALKERLARLEGGSAAPDAREESAKNKLRELLDPVLGPVLKTNQAITDRLEKQDFWEERNYVPQEMREEVEDTLAEARAEGLTATRMDAYMLVRARRADEADRSAAQKVIQSKQRVASVNSKARVLSGGGVARKTAKSLNEMTSAEIEAAYKNIPG